MSWRAIPRRWPTASPERGRSAFPDATTFQRPHTRSSRRRCSIFSKAGRTMPGNRSRRRSSGSRHGVGSALLERALEGGPPVQAVDPAVDLREPAENAKSPRHLAHEAQLYIRAAEFVAKEE